MLDQLSPIAPARVRVVLLPIGQIKRARFLSFVERLQSENVVQLGDISPDGRPNRNMFSPLAFPTGMIVYDLTTSFPPVSHTALSPFEIFREPLVIIAVADGVELDHVSYRGTARRSLNGNPNGPPKPEHNLRELYQDLEDLRDHYPKVLVHQLMVFEHVHKSVDAIPEGVVVVPPPEDCKRTTMKTIMCDISSMLLAEMTHLAKSFQARGTIESPSQTQFSRQHNGTAGPSSISEDLSRRNSQYSPYDHNSRSASPAGPLDRTHVRMSMPAQLRRADSNTSSPSRRPSTPPNGNQTTPTTFDAIVGSNSGTAKSPPKTTSSRFVMADTSRDSSRDRVSVQGFGSNSSSELSRNRGKGRIGVVIGSLYLQTGRWTDALKELVQAASIAKNSLDHLWHAKALDNIVVSMLMLAWAGLDFQIPQVCYVSTEKVISTPGATSSRLVSLQNLAALLPELLDRILNLYTRAANNTGESLPQYPYSESVLRFSTLLSSIHLAGGVIDDDALQYMVTRKQPTRHTNLTSPRLNIRPTRIEIATVVSRAFPLAAMADSLTVVDRILTFSGIASVLGSLGYRRKKAMVIRELVSILIPGLVQARIKGAAEMGVHPAAGLAALGAGDNVNGARTLDLGEGDVENGVDAFLSLLSQTYGVVTSRSSSEETTVFDDSDDAVVARILQNAEVRYFGGHHLKMDVLRSCINLSEALPDFQGVLQFTADLLRTAGSGIAPGPRSEDASPSMTREEQVRLATNIVRTISAARNLGVNNITADYWDEFLVRGIELDAVAPARTPIPHRRSEIPGAAAVTTSRETNPFIYNPFLRTPDTSAVAYLLVAGEAAMFKVTLQNPYDFEVEIESITLESGGVEFEPTSQKTIIGPYRTQILGIRGTPMSPGKLNITGCRVRIRGCRERRFAIFKEPWSPQRTTKIKRIGITALLNSKKRPTSTGSIVPATMSFMKPPTIASLTLNVIDKQPVVVVKSTTLFQSAIMILEGERQVFSITLQNLSRETPVDLLLFSFKDSTQAPLQTAMGNRDASPAELYECELILARKQALRRKDDDAGKPYIKPGGTASFDVEILGRPGLTSAFVQMDYAHMGRPAEEYREDFHTRQVTLPLTITVNASIELVRVDVLPLNGNIPSSLWSNNNADAEALNPEDYCLLILDLRNTWPAHLHVHFDITDQGFVEEDILPGNTSRVIFPMRRVFLKDPAAAIPALDPSRQRQFVVSAGRISADSERAGREAFWYREEVLRTLHATWSTKSGPSRHGSIELRSIRLTQRMIEAIKVDDVGLEISINNAKPQGAKYELFTDSFVEIKVQITNRSTELLFPLLRIQPSVRNQAHNISLDLSKKLVWNGVLQQSIPPLAGGESRDVVVGLTTLCRGQFEISASVEEIRLPASATAETKTESQGRPRANTKTMMDALLGSRERRIWHSRAPCQLEVKDVQSDEE